MGAKRKAIFREMKRRLKTAMDHSKSHFEKYSKAFETMPVGLASATRVLNTLTDSLPKGCPPNRFRKNRRK